MYVNVAVLKETQPHERRVVLAPSVAAKLVTLGAKLHMQSAAGDAVKLTDAAFNNVAFTPPQLPRSVRPASSSTPPRPN